MIWNALFWANYIRAVTLPFFDTYVECVENKLLPAFGNVDEEASKHGEEEYERLSEWAGPDDDPAQVAEWAQDNALRHYETLRDIQQGLLNLLAAALYHQWEQQLLFLYRRELLPPHLENDPGQLTRDHAVKAFANRGIDITKFSTWESMEELRLVANVVKHAEGRSADDLRRKRPDLFRRSDPMLPQVLKKYAPIHLYQPLWGDDFYISTEGYREYAQAIRRFWEQLMNTLLNMGMHGAE